MKLYFLTLHWLTSYTEAYLPYSALAYFLHWRFTSLLCIVLRLTLKTFFLILWSTGIILALKIYFLTLHWLTSYTEAFLPYSASANFLHWRFTSLLCTVLRLTLKTFFLIPWSTGIILAIKIFSFLCTG